MYRFIMINIKIVLYIKLKMIKYEEYEIYILVLNKVIGYL